MESPATTQGCWVSEHLQGIQGQCCVWTKISSVGFFHLGFYLFSFLVLFRCLFFFLFLLTGWLVCLFLDFVLCVFVGFVCLFLFSSDFFILLAQLQALALGPGPDFCLGAEGHTSQLFGRQGHMLEKDNFWTCHFMSCQILWCHRLAECCQICQNRQCVSKIFTVLEKLKVT